METPHPLILLVEREPGGRRALRLALRRLGATVRVARVIDQALHASGEARPDLVVLEEDPDETGEHRFLAPLRSILEKSHVLLLSPRVPGGRQEVRGRLTYADTPSTLEELVDLVSRALPGGLSDPLRPGAPLGKILCVDDDPNYLASLRRLLEAAGYQIQGCGDPVVAIEAFQGFHPDLVILDMMMPGRGGIDLASEIGRRTGGRVPIVFLTALESDEAYYHGHESGARHVLSKTGEPRKILELVDELVENLDPAEHELLGAGF